MIKVLIVDDSPVAQEFMTHILAAQPDMQVVGIANNGEEALELVKEKKPDVITMDIHMPRMDGLETTRQMMEKFPTPIVIVSLVSRVKEAAYTFRLIEAGALAVTSRPPALDDPKHVSSVAELVQTIRLMSEVKVIRRTAGAARSAARVPAPKPAEAKSGIRLIAIGASTGGPAVLRTVLSRLPHDLPVPVVIVQHIAAGFVDGFADWLGGSILLPVHVARNGEKLQPGHCYIAPDNSQMGVSASLHITLEDSGAVNGSRPSVSFLFRTAAENFGPRAAGVLLTGMGKDGAAELKLMRDKGAVTFIQNEESCVVFGMPGEAKKLGAASYTLSPEEIADSLSALAGNPASAE